MSSLKNPKHEAFAQAKARGSGSSAAYTAAGYACNRGNAARMNANESIRARVAELQAQIAQQTVNAISFDAVKMFSELIVDINEAKAAGDYKSAVEGRKFLLRCFGYEASPSLTRQHVNGQRDD